MSYWTRLRESVLLRNTAWMFCGQGIGQLLRAVYFLIVPRALGAEQYGAFVGVTSLAAILAPFASWGAGGLIVKNVSRNKKVFDEYWGNSLLLSVVSGSILIGIMLGVAQFALSDRIPWALIWLVAISDLLFSKILDVGTQAFQAFDLLAATAKLNVLGNLIRILGAVVLVVFFHHADATSWAWCYLFASVAMAAITVTWINRVLGQPVLALWRIKSELLEGGYFSVSMSSQTVYNDIDKTMLVRLSSLDSAGIYAAAYRLVEVAFLPIRSLLWAAYPNFFRHGSNGIGASSSYAKKLIPKAALYSLLAAAALFFGAPIIPYLLGHEYARTVIALRWLAPLPLLKTLHYFVADSLTGAGEQGIRTGVQVGIAVLNILLNLWLIPAYSWRGAAWSSLASDGLLAIGLWTAVSILRRQESSRQQLVPTENLA